MLKKIPKERGKMPISGAHAALLLTFLGLTVLWTVYREPTAQTLTYGELMQIVQADDPAVRFKNVRVSPGEVRGEIVASDLITDKDGTKPATETKLFRTRIGLAEDPDLLKKLRLRTGANFYREEEDTVMRTVSSVLMMVFMVFLFGMMGLFFVRWMSGGSGPLSFGRSKHKLYEDKENRTTFASVAGIDEAVQELREIVDFLKTPEKYQALGGRIPKGVLLVGPPGTGKTLLARAVAGEADVPFFSMSGSDFVEMFVGVGASRVRDLFAQAETRAPCIIFIDELDAMGKTRGHGAVGGHDEREQTLNQLLVEMDGFGSNRGVIIMAATTRPETLDPALLRPGRFDRTVVVDRPDVNGRELILRVHTKDVKVGGDVDLRHVASLTPGSVGADLANLVNEAALLAARGGKDLVEMTDFNEAVERGAIGLERRSRVIMPEEKLRLAYHEGGHALIGCLLPHTTDPIHKVTIIPRGPGVLGFVLHRPDDDRHMKTKSEMLSRIKCALGGTLAEEVVYGEIADGATSDLNSANAIARAMVTRFGMSRLGRIYYRDSVENPYLPGSSFGESRSYSEETAREIDLEVRKIIEDSLAEVKTMLEGHRPALDQLAQRLVEKEVIDGAEVRAILKASIADKNGAGVMILRDFPQIIPLGHPGEDRDSPSGESS